MAQFFRRTSHSVELPRYAKSEAGRRTVPIGAGLSSVLREYREWPAADGIERTAAFGREHQAETHAALHAAARFGKRIRRTIDGESVDFCRLPARTIRTTTVRRACRSPA